MTMQKTNETDEMMNMENNKMKKHMNIILKTMKMLTITQLMHMNRTIT